MIAVVAVAMMMMTGACGGWQRVEIAVAAAAAAHMS